MTVVFTYKGDKDCLTAEEQKEELESFAIKKFLEVIKRNKTDLITPNRFAIIVDFLSSFYRVSAFVIKADDSILQFADLSLELITGDSQASKQPYYLLGQTADCCLE